MKLIFVCLIAATVAGCGTARGVADGVGAVAQGFGEDLSSAGGMLRQ
jgi:predicted small secreted protein